MIIINNCNEIIELPLFERCKRSFNGIYQLILLHRFTRKVIVYKVIDLNFGICPIRLRFNIEFPECAELGEYSYYLVDTNEWKDNEVDINFVSETNRKTDKSAITLNGKFIVSDGKLLVTSWFKSKLLFEGDEVGFKDHPIIIENESEYKNEVGKIADYLTILHTGILKYKIDGICCDFPKYDGKNNKNYIQYNG